MTTLIITVNQDRARVDGMQTFLEKAIKGKFPDARINVEKRDPIESRSDRFIDAQSMVSDAKSEAESLRDELQEWLDNLPENLQSGSKADELQTAIDSLDEFISHCEDAENDSVDFPGMF